MAVAPERRRTKLLFVGLMMGLLLAELDQNVFSTALPTIVGELDGVDQMLWVTTAYVLAATVVMPIYGKLGDLVGRRPLFLVALSIFVAGSLVGGLSPDMAWLIVARVVQGLGGGGLLILVQAIVADLIPARHRAVSMSVVGAVFALSALVGPLLGGWLTDGVGWRWAFWINLPLGGLAITLAATLLPVTHRRTGRITVDVWGITSMAAAVTAVVLLASWGGTQYAWSSPIIMLVAGVALVAAGSFVIVECRAVEPLIPLRIFADRNFATTTVAGLLIAVAAFGTVGYLPTYLQMVSGLTPTRSGLALLALVGGLALSTLVSAQIVSRTGRYKELPVVGSALAALALALMSTLSVQTELTVVFMYLFLLGLGMGCALEILVVIVQNSVVPDEVGTATAAHGFFREIGVSLGTAVVGTLFTSRLSALLADRRSTSGAGALDPDALTPSGLHLLSDPARTAVAASYNDALTNVFGYLVPLLAVSMLVLCLVRPVRLAGRNG